MANHQRTPPAARRPPPPRKRNATRKAATATKANAAAQRRAPAAPGPTRRRPRQATPAATPPRRVQGPRHPGPADRRARRRWCPVGASLLARDNLVSTVKGLATKYRTRASVERELKRYERRGATARNRFERQVRRTRTKFERELRQRRNRVERTVKQNRRRFEREVRSVRKDLEKQSGTLDARASRSSSPTLRPDRLGLLDQLPPPAPRRAPRRDRFAGLISSPANAAPSPPSTAGASRKWRPVGLKQRRPAGVRVTCGNRARRSRRAAVSDDRGAGGRQLAAVAGAGRRRASATGSRRCFAPTTT